MVPKILATGIPFLMVLIICGPIGAQPRDPAMLSALESLRGKTRGGMQETWSRDQQRVEKLNFRRNHPGPYPGTPDQAAIEFLKEARDIFQLTPDLDDLNVEVVREIGGGGQKVKLRQSFRGLPVFGGGLEVILRSDNTIDLVHNAYEPNLTLPIQPNLTAAHVVNIVKEDFMSNCTERESKYSEPTSCQGKPLILRRTPQTILGIFSRKLAYQVTLDVESPRALMEYMVAADTAQVLLKRDLIQNFTGQGNVFDPNPVNSLARYGIVPIDNNDRSSSAFTNAYTPRNLEEITWQVIGNKNYYYLTGPYVNVTDSTEAPFYFSSTSGRISGDRNARFEFTRDKNEFEHVMVYSHIDTNQRYIQSLGFTGIRNNPILVDPHGLNGADQSHYLASPPGGGYLAFGEGGVDDAEDADIILHEYGHAIQDNQAPSAYAAGCGTEAGAMGEGFGDYWAASSTYEATLQNMYPDVGCIGEWDAVPGCLRRVDSSKHYPEAMTGECHADGEIWSAVLWEIFNLYGRQMADRLILQSHFNVNSLGYNFPTFRDGALAILKSDEQLNAAGGRLVICNVMIQRGILNKATDQECTWEPWGATLSQNNWWTWTSDPDPIPNLTPGTVYSGALSLDTNLMPTRGEPLIPNISSLSLNAAIYAPGVIPPGATKLIISMKSHGFYNIYPDGECHEWALIRFYNLNANPATEFHILVTNSSCIYSNYPLPSYSIINDNQWTTYEIPLTSLNGDPTHFIIDVHDRRYKTDSSGNFPYYWAYYALDIDFIDFQ